LSRFFTSQLSGNEESGPAVPDSSLVAENRFKAGRFALWGKGGYIPCPDTESKFVKPHYILT
jgi:hypothetical protein